MKKNILLLAMVSIIRIALGQGLIAIPKSNSITAKKIDNVELIIPIDFDFYDTGGGSSKSLSLVIANNAAKPFQLLNATKVNILNNNQNVTLTGSTWKTANGVFLKVDNDLNLEGDKIFFIEVHLGGVKLNEIQVTLSPSNDKVYTQSEYLKTKGVKLDYVTRVEPKDNMLIVYGYIGNNFVKRSVMLEKHKILSIREWSWVGQGSHWTSVPISLTTVPFKIRPKLTYDSTTLNSDASAGLSNVGFNIDLGKLQIDRYMANGRKSSHKFSLGFWVAPGVEEMDSVHTKGYLNGSAKSKQFVISSGLTISYAYNGLTFTIVPAAWDSSPTEIGKKWVYHNKYWFGFGIGLNPVMLAAAIKS